ncbi:Homeodomain-containing transcription factor [Pyrenophora tritici-repentis]|nr:Homeodomain-containing transcription factor [Pyrenophora tritici-repentis]KAI2481948.1 Homeodomain-containing transcription factor [Pyrenophora tritici-repentis]
MVPDAINHQDIQSKTQITVLDTTSVLQPEHLSQKPAARRCSACEIAALIDPDHLSTCSSCDPIAYRSSPESPICNSRIKRSGARRPPTKLESHALRCLREWLHENRKNPYPDADTKRSLAQRCGITEKQVNTWFTNARARGKLLKHNASDSASEDEGSSTSKRSSTAPAVKKKNSLSPTARFNPNYPDISCSASSSYSQEIEVPPTSRRGKKKDYGQLGVLFATPHALHIQSEPTVSTISAKGNGSETWQCTFCYQRIAHKSWRRHEETQHRPKRKWTCLLTGPSLHVASRTAISTYCVFCKIPDPSEDHLLLAHRISECANKSEHERTFLRPDHLRQHVNNFHKAPLDGEVRDLWRRGETGDETAEDWICGFCGHELKTWEARERHIAKHFKDGSTMTDWKEHTNLVAGADPSKKRPTSSEGRPNALPKIARMHTDLPVRQQHQHESDRMIVDGLDSSFEIADTDTMLSRSPLDGTFGSFIPLVWDRDYVDTSGKDLCDRDNALDSGCESGLPGIDNGEFGLESFGAGWLEGTLGLSECWLW